MKRALVAGGLGLIGRNVVDSLTGLADWDVVAISRRPADFETRSTYLSVDLLDRSALEAVRSKLEGVTHVFYAAWRPMPSAAEEVEPNLAMLRNVVEVVEKVSPDLEHVQFSQGSKVYGAHLGPYRTPARETDPRHIPPNFYFDQEDYVCEAQRTKKWSFSILRPNSPCGFAVGNPMNLIMVLGVYAAITKELELPLRFPGSPTTYSMLYEVTDMGLLARASTWAATTESASNQAFNVSNGDYFRWEHMWPKIADFFGMEIGAPQTIKLSERMADKGEIWNRIVEQHRLVPYSYRDIVSWGYGDSRLNREWETLMNTNKIRLHGFTEVIDTEDMFMRIFDDLRSRRVLP